MSNETILVQITTRIPKTLHRKIKLHCVIAGTPLMEFVGKAIAEKLARQNAGRQR